MNNQLVLIILFGMVRTGAAFQWSSCMYAPERGVFRDLLDSTAFNVAMFAMGWAATRLSMKGNEQLFGLHWFKAIAASPFGLLPSARVGNFSKGVKASPAINADQQECIGGASLEMEPLPVENSESDTLLWAGLSTLLASRAGMAESEELPPWRRSCFHSKESLDMSLSDYIAHIHWFFECSSPCLVIALIYIDRAISGTSKLALNAETCHRLFATSLLAAVKFHDDDYTPYPNAYYADMAHVGVKELNAMEKQFCKSIDWHFYVRPEEYAFYHGLITTAALAASA